jgi:hypothetical protein
MNENLITIAKACGFEYSREKCRLIGCNDTHEVLRVKGRIEWPKFDTLDSLQAAVLMQDEEFQRRFAFNLAKKAEWYSPEPPQLMHTAAIHKLTVTDWQQAFVETLEQLKRV